MCDLSGPTLNHPRLGFSYVLPRLWDPGGVRSTPDVPRKNLDQSRSLAASRYPYAAHMSHLVNLTSLQQSQDLCMFHIEANSIFHENITDTKTAMTKTTSNISVNIPALTQPTLMHYELCVLHVEHACPYDRQSSCVTFTATVTSYIQVTTSPYEGHTSHPSFSQLLHHTSRFLQHSSGLPKLLHWLHLTHLMTLALWGVPYK